MLLLYLPAFLLLEIGWQWRKHRSGSLQPLIHELINVN